VDSTWYDVTDQVEGLDDFEVVFRQEQGTEKGSESGVSLQITFSAGAGALIKEWLLDTPCSYINYFDVEITDTVCQLTYKGYELKPDNMEFCEDDGCYFTLALKEGEDKYRELKKLSIHDNWQKWFSEDGPKNHPTFQVVIQQEPTAIGMKAGPLLFLISIPGIGLIFNELLQAREDFKRMLGFGRYHAAPKVYDILLNACLKIGLSMDTPFDPARELHNDCLFIPYSGYYHENFSDNPPYQASPSTKHIWNNRYIWQVTDFLDELCKLYNMKWDIVNGVLKVEFMKDIVNSTEEFEIGEYDNLCYEFDLTKKPAYGRYEYSTDAGDSASNQVQVLYNDIVDYDGVAQNPMLEGGIQKRVQFASTGFYCDGFGFDYMQQVSRSMKYAGLAILATLILSIASFAAQLNPAPLIIIISVITAQAVTIIARANAERNRYACSTSFAGIIRVWGSGVVSVPRIIRWDTSTPMNNAKAVMNMTGAILPNTRYNNDPLQYYQDFYSGSGTYKQIDKVWNYPLYFDSMFYGNLYDTYHEVVDNPLIVNFGHQQVTVSIPLCCDNINAVGAEMTGETIVGRIVKVKDDVFMYVTEATISYNTRSIKLKGKIVRR
jgi:hypothetical protein